MSFHLSAQDIRLEDGHILKARLHNGDDHVDAQIDLNTFIGNDDGNFQWDGRDFSHSAEGISFSLEGDDNVPILRAGLRDNDGNVQWRDLNLSERLGNSGGSFNWE
ncbi:Cyanovirin-N [Cladorrhinum sp. PSN259]|nr:Cyanovirin-N [Cladorrhinum sp. PSN259]